MDPQQAQAQAAHIMAVMLPLIGLITVVVYVLLIIPQWKIATKAGLSGPLSLLTLIPGVGLLISLYVIAFMEWKVVPAAGQYAATPYPPSTYPPAGPSAY